MYSYIRYSSNLFWYCYTTPFIVLHIFQKWHFLNEEINLMVITSLLGSLLQSHKVLQWILYLKMSPETPKVPLDLLKGHRRCGAP